MYLLRYLLLHVSYWKLVDQRCLYGVDFLDQPWWLGWSLWRKILWHFLLDFSAPCSHKKPRWGREFLLQDVRKLLVLLLHYQNTDDVRRWQHRLLFLLLLLCFKWTYCISSFGWLLERVCCLVRCRFHDSWRLLLSSHFLAWSSSNVTNGKKEAEIWRVPLISFELVHWIMIDRGLKNNITGFEWVKYCDLNPLWTSKYKSDLRKDHLCFAHIFFSELASPAIATRMRLSPRRRHWKMNWEQ